jgi:hypothetical protein
LFNPKIKNFINPKFLFSLHDLKDFIRDFPLAIQNVQHFTLTELIDQNPSSKNYVFLPKLNRLFQANILRQIYIDMVAFAQANPQVDVTRAVLINEFLHMHQVLYELLMYDRQAMNMILMTAVYFHLHRYSSLTLIAHDDLPKTLIIIYNAFNMHPNFNQQIFKFSVVVEEILREFLRRINNGRAPPSQLAINFLNFLGENHVEMFGMHSAYGDAPHLVFRPCHNFVKLRTTRH